MVAAAILFSAGSASAVEKPRQGEDILLDTYHRNMAKLETNSFGLPLFLESFERDERVHVDVYGIFDYPFSSVVNVLKVPANWCDIVSLNPNVKACTYRELPGAWLLTFYIGRKVYQPPEDTRQVIYHYRNVDQQHGYLDIILSADAGPFGTKDHRMRFEALPLDGGRTFVHVSYAYSDSAALRLAEKALFCDTRSEQGRVHGDRNRQKRQTRLYRRASRRYRAQRSQVLFRDPVLHEYVALSRKKSFQHENQRVVRFYDPLQEAALRYGQKRLPHIQDKGAYEPGDTPAADRDGC